MTPHSEAWPSLPFEALAPTVDHLRRLVQIAGKYTLDQTFETAWGNIVFDVTPRGLRTPVLRSGDTSFQVHYRLLDGDVLIEAGSGIRTLPLRAQSVADFFKAFVTAATELGLPALGSTTTCEIEGAPTLDADQTQRPWDEAAARLIWAGFNAAAGALERWQAPYRGHRPRVGVMWGGFDLSATRFRAVSVKPPADRPVYMQQGMSEACVAVGFSFGSPESPSAGIYAYIAPQPKGLETRSWGVDGGVWIPAAGLAVLPWDKLRLAADPQAAIVAFADAVYAAAVETAGWPEGLVAERHDGWYASKTPPAQA